MTYINVYDVIAARFSFAVMFLAFDFIRVCLRLNFTLHDVKSVA